LSYEGMLTGEANLSPGLMWYVIQVRYFVVPLSTLPLEAYLLGWMDSNHRHTVVLEIMCFAVCFPLGKRYLLRCSTT